MCWREAWLIGGLCLCLSVAAGCTSHPPVIGSQSPQHAATADGRVVGTFLAVGGPVGARSEAQRGYVYLSAGSKHMARVKVGPNGRFTLLAGGGDYQLAGRTPQFIIDGRQGLCTASHDVRVSPGRTTHVNVYCERN